MMITENPIWYSPWGAYNEYLKLVEEVGYETIEKDRKYQKVMEARAVAILGLAMYQAKYSVWYMQLCKNDPPDALIMRISPDDPTTHEVLGIEVTTYMRNPTGIPKDSVFEQLKNTKMFSNYHKYTDHDVILVDLGWHYKPNFLEMQQYMEKIDAPYQLWFIQEVESKPNTILEMTVMNKELASTSRLDIGQAMHDMKEAGTYAKIKTQRVGSAKQVGSRQTAPIPDVPWGLIK